MVINKRAQQMTLGTIIAIVLGIAVLILLIMGFTTGWNNMWNKIDQFGGGKVNVNAVVQGCELACSSESVYDYCSKERKLVLDGNITGLTDGDYTCKDLEKYKSTLGMKDCDLDCGVAKTTSKEDAAKFNTDCDNVQGIFTEGKCTSPEIAQLGSKNVIDNKGKPWYCCK